MPQFPHLGGNDCVKDLSSANENTRSTCCWVDSLGLAIPIVVIHKPGSCSWEEFTAALQGVNFLLHWLYIDLFLRNAANTWKENKLSYSLP